VQLLVDNRSDSTKIHGATIRFTRILLITLTFNQKILRLLTVPFIPKMLRRHSETQNDIQLLMVLNDVMTFLDLGRNAMQTLHQVSSTQTEILTSNLSNKLLEQGCLNFFWNRAVNIRVGLFADGTLERNSKCTCNIKLLYNFYSAYGCNL